jgi:hypothetical protein
MQRLALLATITVTAAIMSVLVPYQTIHATPCLGAVQADKDNIK